MTAHEASLERGQHGLLHFRTHPVEDHGIVEHRDAFTYLGDWDEMRCFVDGERRRVYLHPEEIVSFDEFGAAR